ncbi:MAG: VgrG-related protein [Chloroflexi bacterium]|nr:VgrG-related protein [Chloroflexota bacterium]
MADGDHSLAAIVEIDGSPLDPVLEPQLEAVVVDDHLHLPAMFVLVFRDLTRTILAEAKITIGARIVITGTSLGESRPRPLVTGEVTALEAEYDALGSRAIVRGYDPSHRFHRGTRTETYINVTDSDIVRTVATRAGVEIGTIDASSTTHDHVSQANVSDWEFLKARARATGFQLTMLDGKLQFRKPAPASEAPGVSGFESTDTLQMVMGQDLLEFRPRITSSEQVAEVEVRSWDVQAKQPITAVEASAASSAQLPTRPEELAGRFGGGRLMVGDEPLSSGSSVGAAAVALAEQVGTAFAEADGVARGTPTLRAGTPFSVSVVGPDFEGGYVATTTRHVFDRDGYRTEFTVSGQQDRSLLGLVEPGGRSGAGPGAMSGVTPGIVSDIDDPLGQGRVKVQLPLLSDQYVSDWARVCLPGAAKDRGLVMLPEVGDEVLVVFESGDVRRPYVLGGLWNGQDTPPLGSKLIENGMARRRGLVSRRNHRIICMDAADDDGIAILTGEGGMRLALDRTESRIHLFSDGRIVIEADQDIEIRTKGSMTLDAQRQLTLKGASGVSISSSATVDIDGAMISLN